MEPRHSLGELLDKALRVLYGDRPVDSPNWLARRAIEAVCEEIIRSGQIFAPLKVRFVPKSPFKLNHT